MRDLNYSFKQVVARNRDGSASTRANRERLLSLMADHLHEMGFKHVRSGGDLAQKHTWALVNRWRHEGIDTGTVKNRLSALRWICEKTGNANAVANDNAHYGIGKREFANRGDRSLLFEQSRLNQLPCEYLRASAGLQKYFGLRRAEAIKFTPSWAIRGDQIVLKKSWCKGGIERTIPIRTDQQREALAYASRVAGKQSLIPSDRKYYDQMKYFEREMSKIGYGQSHGARHLYAQTLYENFTRFVCPAKGGTPQRKLTPAQRKLDKAARLIISRELGHSRLEVTNSYLGTR